MSSDRQAMERRDNIRAILGAIRRDGSMTRRDLAERLSLSWGCVSESVAILLKDGYVLEVEASDDSTCGRCPKLLSLSPAHKLLGIDVNLMGITACVCDLWGELCAEYLFDCETESRQALLSSIMHAIDETRTKHPQIRGIGFAMQGMQNPRNGIRTFPADPPIEIDFQADLADHLDLPTTVEHDPCCMLLSVSEPVHGESRMLLRLDRGIGVAIYSSDRFFRNGLLELGYTVISEDGERLHELVNVKEIDAIADLHRRRTVIERAARHLGIALGNLCNLITPNEIILCGEMLKYRELLLPCLIQAYRHTVLPLAEATITVSDMTSAALGAAKLALNAFPY